MKVIVFLLSTMILNQCNTAQTHHKTPSGLAYSIVKADKAPAAQAGNDILNSRIVFQSKDQGETWEDISTGLPNNLQVEYVTAKNGIVLLGTENGGLYQSGTNVLQWKKIGGTPVFPNEKITGIFPTPTGLFVSVFRGGFFQDLAHNGHWSPAHNTLKDKAVRAVLKAKNTLLVGADYGIYQSKDNGKSWRHVFADGQVTSLVEYNGILIGGTYRGVVRSTDEGEHWEWVLEDGAVHKTTVIDGQFAVIALSGGIRASSDGGTTWKPIDQGLPPEKPVYDIEKSGSFWVCSHDDGLFRSADRGQHWELIRATPAEKFLDLAVANDAIYGGTVRR